MKIFTMHFTYLLTVLNLRHDMALCLNSVNHCLWSRSSLGRAWYNHCQGQGFDPLCSSLGRAWNYHFQGQGFYSHFGHPCEKCMHSWNCEELLIKHPANGTCQAYVMSVFVHEDRLVCSMCCTLPMCFSACLQLPEGPSTISVYVRCQQLADPLTCSTQQEAAAW